MAQAQLDARAKLKNTFFFELNGQLSVKIWKKGREGVYATLVKPGITQRVTIPIQVLTMLFEAQDVMLLAADFIKGLIGFSPDDLNTADQRIKVSVFGCGTGYAVITSFCVPSTTSHLHFALSRPR